jgi:hypothetical protein
MLLKPPTTQLHSPALESKQQTLLLRCANMPDPDLAKHCSHNMPQHPAAAAAAGVGTGAAGMAAGESS